jgi:hypothetical protein
MMRAFVAHRLAVIVAADRARRAGAPHFNLWLRPFNTYEECGAGRKDS